VKTDKIKGRHKSLGGSYARVTEITIKSKPVRKIKAPSPRRSGGK
jgi:hypothetical protein